MRRQPASDKITYLPHVHSLAVFALEDRDAPVCIGLIIISRPELRDSPPRKADVVRGNPPRRYPAWVASWLFVSAGQQRDPLYWLIYRFSSIAVAYFAVFSILPTTPSYDRRIEITAVCRIPVFRPFKS